MSKLNRGAPIASGKYNAIISKPVNPHHNNENVIYYHHLDGMNDIRHPYIMIGAYAHRLKKLDYSDLQFNYLYMNNDDRIMHKLDVGEKCCYLPIVCPSVVSKISVVIMDADKKTSVQISADEIPKNISNILHKRFDHTVVNLDTDPIISDGPKIYRVKIFSFSDNITTKYAFVEEKTEFIVVNQEKNNSCLRITSIDYQTIGIGGLTNEFRRIVERLLLTRLISSELLKKTGVRHPKGVILYGPPGCGKTLIARNIGKAIGCVEKNIDVVNGPEILSKYVGQSEENIRSKFQRAKSRPEELFILIFDEIDAIAAKRSSGDTHRHNDQVLTQILTMMDGVDEINNLIIFGLTNRLDILDPAILRPGRFDLHLNISMPNYEGRYEILMIHTESPRENGLFDTSVDLHEIARQTENFTGAELAQLVQSTVSRVIDQNIDYTNISQSAKQIKTIRIKQADFLVVLHEMIPALKPPSTLLQDLALKIRKKFTKSDIDLYYHILEYYNCQQRPIISCICGKPKSGKTSIVCKVAGEYRSLNTQYIDSYIFLRSSNTARIDYLIDVFESPTPGLIIMDNFENIIEFVSEHNFNNTVFHTIKTLLCNTIHHVIITTSYYDRLASMTIFDDVENVFVIQ